MTDEREALIEVIRALDHPRIPTLAATEYAKIADAILATGYTRPSPRAPSGWRDSEKVKQLRVQAIRVITPDVDSLLLMTRQCERELDALCDAVAAVSGSPPSPEKPSARVLDAINWLMGCNGTFEPSPDQRFRGEVPPYWFRSKFAERARLLYDGERYHFDLPDAVDLVASSGSTGAPLDQPTPEETP